MPLMGNRSASNTVSRLVLVSLAILGLAGRAEALDADHWRGGWRTPLGDEPHIYEFVIKGNQVSGAYCRNCSDATTIGFIDGTWNEKAGLRFTVTFADPTGLGINPKIDEGKTEAAKQFLAYAAGPDGAKALAAIGITPADTAAVKDSFFEISGVPTDELSKFTFATHDTKPENPVSKYTAPLQNILNDLHSAVLSGSKPVDAAIAEAQDRAKNEVLSK